MRKGSKNLHPPHIQKIFLNFLDLSWFFQIFTDFFISFDLSWFFLIFPDFSQFSWFFIIFHDFHDFSWFFMIFMIFSWKIKNFQKVQNFSHSIWKVPKMFWHLERPETSAAHRRYAPETSQHFWDFFITLSQDRTLSFKILLNCRFRRKHLRLGRRPVDRGAGTSWFLCQWNAEK